MSRLNHRYFAPLAVLLATLFLLSGCLQDKEKAEARRLERLQRDVFAIQEELLLNGDADKAIAKLEKLNDKHPNQLEVVDALGLAYDEKGDSMMAAFFFDHALELAPGQAGLAIAAARAHEKSGNASEAAAAYRTYLRLNPQATDIWRNIALLEMEQQNYQPALSAYLEALRADKGQPAAQDRLNVATLYHKLGNQPQAQRWYEDLLAQEGVEPALRAGGMIGLFDLSLRQRQWERALELMHALEEQSPGVLKNGEYASAYAELYEWDNARKAAAQAEQEKAAAQKKAQSAAAAENAAAGSVGAVATAGTAVSAATAGSASAAAAAAAAVTGTAGTVAGTGAAAGTETVTASASGAETTTAPETATAADTASVSGAVPVASTVASTAAASVSSVPAPVPETVSASGAAIGGDTTGTGSATVSSSEPTNNAAVSATVDTAGATSEAATTATADGDTAVATANTMPTNTALVTADGTTAATTATATEIPVVATEDSVSATTEPPVATTGSPVAATAGTATTVAETSVAAAPSQSANGEEAAALAQDHSAAELAARGRAAFEAEDFATAVEVLERSVKLNPNDAEVLDLLSRASYSEGRYPQAERYAMLATYAQPQEVNYRLEYLRAYQRNHPPASMLQQLISAREAFPQDPNVTLALARGYEYIAGRKSLAAPLYHEYLEKMPNSPLVPDIQQKLLEWEM